MDDFLKNNILTNLKINGNETLALYFSNQANLEGNNVTRNLFLCDLENLTTRVLDLSTKWVDYEFLNDEIILKTYEDSSTEFYKFNIATNKISFYIKVDHIVEDFSIDGNTMYFVSGINQSKRSQTIGSGTVIPLYKDGQGFIGDSMKALLKVDIGTGSVTKISPSNVDIDDISFDFTNNNIVFTAFGRKTFKPVPSDIYTYNLIDASIKCWTKGNFRISYGGMLTEDKLIFLGLDLNKKERNDNHELYIIEMNNRDCRKLDSYSDKSNESFGGISDMKYSISRPVNFHNNNFYFLTLENTKAKLNKVNKKEEISSIDIGLNSIECFQVLEDGILAIGLKGFSLHELYKFEIGDLIQITNHNKWLTGKRNVIKPYNLNIRHNGIDIQGWVMPPLNVEENKKYPAVLVIHGGPKLAFSEIYHHDIQVLAANGYYVLYANPMGSDSYGEEFLNIRGSFAKLPYEQLMNFTDEAIKKYPQIDKLNLGVIGRSYGGYLTNYIIGKTSRFKAAISESGISNLVTAFTSSDIGYQYILEYMGGETPWINMDAYLDESPITRANKVTAATLFIHGKKDYRCNYTETLNMYTAISYHNIDTKLYILEDESHTLGCRATPKNRYGRYKSIINWFDRYLKKE